MIEEEILKRLHSKTITKGQYDILVYLFPLLKLDKYSKDLKVHMKGKSEKEM